MENIKLIDANMHRIGQEISKIAEDIAKRNIPTWKQKLMKLTKRKGGKPLLHFGYRIDVQYLPPLESDIIRSIVILKKNEKQLEAKELRIMNEGDHNSVKINVKLENRTIPYEQ